MKTREKVIAIGKLKNPDALIRRIRNISVLSGSQYNINVNIVSNGKEDSENPAYYGSLHDKGKKYPFSKRALKNFRRDIVNDVDFIDEVQKIFTDKRVKYHHRKVAELMARTAYDNVMEYLLYEMPQREQKWKKNGKRNLEESGLLWESIISDVVDKKSGKIVWRGK